MIEIETLCPDCGHDDSGHYALLGGDPTPCPCLECGCRRTVRPVQDKIGEHKSCREADEIGINDL